MRHDNECPLPTGVKFFIWPRYVLSVDGVEVRLSRYRAKILLFLMSRPEARFSTREIARAIYWDRDDGGATSDVVQKQVFDLLRDCRASGIDLRLKKPGAYQGYAYMGVGLVGQPIRVTDGLTATAEARPETAADMAMRVSLRIQQDADAGKPPGGSRKPKTGQVIIRQPDTVEGTDGWMFTANYERQYHRRGGKDVAE